MATTYKVLGQHRPSSTSDELLYTVGAGKSAVVSTITVANLNSSAQTFSIAIVPYGYLTDPVLDLKHYIASGATVAAHDTTAFTLGITLASGDSIYVFNAAGAVAFSAFGSEIA